MIFLNTIDLNNKNIFFKNYDWKFRIAHILYYIILYYIILYYIILYNII